MTTGDWDEPKTYYFSVPLMNTQERATQLLETLNAALDMNAPHIDDDNCKVFCRHNIQIIEVSLCSFQIASTQYILDAINATSIDVTNTTYFHATQVSQGFAIPYLPSSSMGSSQNPLTFSDDENTTTYSSGSDDTEHYWSILPTP